MLPQTRLIVAALYLLGSLVIRSSAAAQTSAELGACTDSRSLWKQFDTDCCIRLATVGPPQLCLDVKSASKAPGADLDGWECLPQSYYHNQEFLFNKTTATLQSKQNFFCVEAAASTVGAKVVMEPCVAGKSTQQWDLVPQAGSSAVRMVTKSSQEQQLCLILAAAKQPATVVGLQEPTTIDVARDYGNISFQSISSAMERAQQAVASSNASVVVFLEAGKHTVDMAGGSLFDVSSIVSKAGQHLIVAGAGMDDTTLVTRTHGNDVIHAKRGPGEPMWRGVRFENITFAREGQTTTQSRLVAADEEGIEIEVVEGFPQLDEVMVETYGRQPPSMWFRRYTVASGSTTASGSGGGSSTTDTDTAPRLVTDKYDSAYWKPLVNQQVSFSCCNTSNVTAATTGGAACQHTASAWICPNVRRVPGTDRRWRLSVTKWPVWPTDELPRYQEALHDPNQRVAVKIKHGGQAYHMQAGDDVGFVNVRWLGHSRGAIIDTSNVLFRNTRVDRLPAPAAGSEAPVLASNAGGPQVLGNSVPVYNLTVVNHTSTATGDDSLALFNVKTGSVSGCSIRDAFGRGIVLCSAAGVRMSDNELVRNPLFRVNASSYALCLCTSNPHAGPELPQCVYPPPRYL